MGGKKGVLLNLGQYTSRESLCIVKMTERREGVCDPYKLKNMCKHRNNYSANYMYLNKS
jgi:hypothetical protein